MRTTINVDDQLLVQAKAQATTLGGDLGPNHRGRPASIPHALRERGASRTRTTDHHERNGNAARHRPRPQSLATGDHGAMILMDVNILVYAQREDTTDHPAYRAG